MKQFKVIYRSRYHPMEGERSKIVQAASRSEIRKSWHDIVHSDEYRIERIEDIDGSGLKIRTITGAEFDVSGSVTHKDIDNCGRVYYCAGQSWPEEIVSAVI